MPHNRINLFDDARLLAALAVMFSHHFAFNGLPEPRVFGFTKVGTFAVIVFFSISGYLITKSYLRSDGILDYLSKRCRRIFPALIACSMMMIYVLCPLFGTGNGWSYISSQEALRQFCNYITLDWIPVNINGFASNYIHKNALNGSLWSLGYEFTAYVLLLVFLYTKKRIILKSSIALVACISIAFATQLDLFSYNARHFINDYIVLYGSLARGSLFLIPFASGVFLCATQKYWDNLKLKTIIVLFFILLVITLSEKSEVDILFYLSTPFIIIPILVSLKSLFVNGRYDFSYGIYICISYSTNYREQNIIRFF